jgi:hypothetical protein
VSAYQACRDGDCWPDTCPVCEQQCDACGEWLNEGVCPTLPIDNEDTE